MDVVPFFGSSFHDYFPILITILCVGSLLDLYERILRCLSQGSFECKLRMDEDQLKEGKLLLDRAKRNRGDVEIATTDREVSHGRALIGS